MPLEEHSKWEMALTCTSTLACAHGLHNQSLSVRESLGGEAGVEPEDLPGRVQYERQRGPTAPGEEDLESSL